MRKMRVYIDNRNHNPQNCYKTIKKIWSSGGCITKSFYEQIFGLLPTALEGYFLKEEMLIDVNLNDSLEN